MKFLEQVALKNPSYKPGGEAFLKDKHGNPILETKVSKIAEIGTIIPGRPYFKIFKSNGEVDSTLYDMKDCVKDKLIYKVLTFLKRENY